MDVSEISSPSRAPTSARERSRRATRARLLSAGHALFAARGLHGVTTHDIARAAGVASGTFYLHFSDKQTLFREIVYGAVGHLRERLENAFAAAADLPASVRAHAEALLLFAEENADLVRIVFGRDNRDVEIEADVLDYLAAAGADMLRERIATGAVRSTVDPAVASHALTGMFARVITWWVEDGMQTPRDAMVETLVGFQLQGLYKD
jgi:AcrR family transcriptional regulator